MQKQRKTVKGDQIIIVWPLSKVKGLQFLLRWHAGKQPACLGRRHKRHTSDPWVKNIPWRRKWQPFWYSCLGNRTDREASWATAHGVAKHWT